MSVLAVRWAAEQIAGGPMPKLVLFALAEHADSTGRCHPSLSTLAGETEASPATVKRALASLVERQLITRTPRTRGTGATTSTGYTLALPVQGVAHAEPGAGSERATPRLGVSPHARLTASHQGEPPVEPTTEPSSVARPRTRGTATAAELSATAVRPDAYRLVAAWREQTGAAYRPTTIRTLAKHADTLLRDGGDPAAVHAALEEWNRRPDARPGLLPHLYDDAVKARNVATSPAGLSKRDSKAAGWFALAAEFEREGQDDEQAVDGELLALNGGLR